VLTAEIEEGGGAPGEILAQDQGGPLVAAGSGALRLLRVQPEGKRAMDGTDYLRGHALVPASRLG
jgi:methionyl-tRNA formyltransferase